MKSSALYLFWGGRKERKGAGRRKAEEEKRRKNGRGGEGDREEEKDGDNDEEKLRQVDNKVAVSVAGPESSVTSTRPEVAIVEHKH